MKKTLIAAAVSALFAGQALAVVDLRTNNNPVTYATTQALQTTQPITADAANSTVQDIRSVVDFGIPAGSVHYVLLRLDNYDTKFATIAQPTIDYTTVHNNSLMAGGAGYDARGDLGDVFVAGERYVFTGEQIRVAAGATSLAGITALSGNALSATDFAELPGYDDSDLNDITWNALDAGNYFLYRPVAGGAYRLLNLEDAFDLNPATSLSFGGNGETSVVFGVNTQASGAEVGTRVNNEATTFEEVRINSVPKSASFVFSIDGLTVNGTQITNVLNAGDEPVVRATYAVFPGNASLQAQQAAQAASLEAAQAIFAGNTFAQRTAPYIKFGEGLTVAIQSNINKQVDVVNEAGELFVIDRRNGLRLVNENATRVDADLENATVNTGNGTTVVGGATNTGIADSTLILVEDRDDAEARFVNLATFDLSVSNLRNINGSALVGDLTTLFNGDPLNLSITGDFTARDGNVVWTATDMTNSNGVTLQDLGSTGTTTSARIANTDLSTTELRVTVRYNVTGSDFIDPNVEYLADARQGSSQIIDELFNLGAFGANATSFPVHFALTPGGNFSNFLRITNPTNAAGGVSIDVFNDAGEKVTIQLEDIEGFTTSTLAANQSTRLIPIDQVYAAAAAVDSSFAISENNSQTVNGTVVGDKLRLVVNADLGELDVQAVTLSRDGNTFSTF